MEQLVFGADRRTSVYHLSFRFDVETAQALGYRVFFYVVYSHMHELYAVIFCSLQSNLFAKTTAGVGCGVCRRQFK